MSRRVVGRKVVERGCRWRNELANGSALLGVVFAAAWVLGGPTSTAAPLQVVTDQFMPYENLSDAEAPGFSTEVFKRVFAGMGQEVSFEEFAWPRALEQAYRGERDAIFTTV